MRKYRFFLLLLFITSGLLYQMVIVNPVIASRSTVEVKNLPYLQITPTGTPMGLENNEALTTDPIFMQVIILLGIIAVLIIFLGVWINRRQLENN